MSSVPPPPGMPTSEPALWAPYYGASIGTAFARFWRKYATFSGRASRSEYWWWQLIYFIYIVVVEIALASAGAVTSSVNSAAAPSPAYFLIVVVIWVISLGTLIPTLAVIWRRLHDTNRSGAYYLLGLIPVAGPIILLVFLASASNPAGARFDQPHA
jgi:uncharacterized membrane protein YhaH (DUF805 family)